MRPKLIAILSLAVLAIIVLWQNTEYIRVSFVFWHVTLPKIFLITGVFLLGFFIGFFTGKDS